MPTKRRFTMACLGLVVGAGCTGLRSENPSDTADYTIPLDIVNDHDREHTFEITIADDTGEVYKEFGVLVPPGNEVKVTPFTDLEPTGVEEFLVTIAISGYETREWPAEMNECFGDLDVRITKTGELIGGPTVC